MIFAVVLITGIAGAGMYVMKLRSDNATLKANQIKLETAVAEQTKVLEKQKADFKAIMESNKKLNVLINTFKQDLDDLDKRFTKKNRDIGKLSIKRTEAMERIINKGGKNASRCTLVGIWCRTHRRRIKSNFEITNQSGMSCTGQSELCTL